MDYEGLCVGAQIDNDSCLLYMFEKDGSDWWRYTVEFNDLGECYMFKYLNPYGGSCEFYDKLVLRVAGDQKWIVPLPKDAPTNPNETDLFIVGETTVIEATETVREMGRALGIGVQTPTSSRPESEPSRRLKCAIVLAEASRADQRGSDGE